MLNKIRSDPDPVFRGSDLDPFLIEGYDVNRFFFSGSG